MLDWVEAMSVVRKSAEPFGKALLTIASRHGRAVVFVVAAALSSVYCFFNYSRRSNMYEDIVRETLQSESENTPQRYKGLEAFLLSAMLDQPDRAGKIDATVRNARLSADFMIKFKELQDALGVLQNQPPRPVPLKISSGTGDRTVLTEQDSATDAAPGYLFLPLNLLRTHFSKAQLTYLASGSGHREREEIVNQAFRRDPVLISDVYVSQRLARLLQELTGTSIAIPDKPGVVKFTPAQVYYITATGINRIFTPSNLNPEGIYKEQFVATTFFPSRFYFWRAFGPTRDHLDPPRPTDTVGGFFSVSQPYMDLGGNGMVVTLAKGLRLSRLSDAVVCFDLRLAARYDVARSLNKRIGDLRGVAVETECQIPDQGDARCPSSESSARPAHASLVENIADYVFEGVNLGFKERALTEALGEFITEKRNQLAEVCGNVQVLEPNREADQPPGTIRFSVPLGGIRVESEKGSRFARFLVAQINPVEFQKRTVWIGIWGAILFASAVFCMVLLLGSAVGKRKEYDLALGRVGKIMYEAPTPYLRLDSEDKIQDANLAICRLLEYPPDEEGLAKIKGKQFIEFFKSDRASVTIYDEVQARRKLGQPVRPYELALRGAAGHVTQVRVVSADVPSTQMVRAGLPETFGVLLEPLAKTEAPRPTLA